MKKIILLAIVGLSTLFSSAQCSADFTWTTTGNTVQFNNTSSGTNFNDWSFGDGGTSSTTNPSHTYSMSGSYTVCLYSYYADSSGNFCNDSICYQIAVQGSSGNGCSINAAISAQNGTIIGTNNTVGGNSFEWSVTDNNTGTGLYNTSSTNLSYTPGYNGNFWVCLTAYDSAGNVCDTLCDIVTVIDSSGAGCSVNANVFESNGQIIGNNTSTGASSYSWTVSDYNAGTWLYNSSSTNLNYTPGYNGDFLICLTAYQANGNVCDTLCDVVTVIDSSGTGCSVNATISESNGQIIGNNTSTGASSYSWTVSDYNTGQTLSNSQSTNLSYFPGYFGDFLICLTAYEANGNICDTLCSFVTIVDSMGTGCVVNTWIYGQNGEIIGTNNSTGANSYSWIVYEYNSWSILNTTTSTNLSYTPGYFGNFFVCLTAFDTTGNICDSLCEMITLLPDSLDSTSGIAPISLNEFQLFPNPTNSVLNLKFDHLPSNSHALIVDMLGREMIEVDLTTQVTEIQVAEFPSGIYLVQLIDVNNQIIGMTKFIRE